MNTEVQIIFHSLHGHVYQLAEAVAAGAREVEGVDVYLSRVPDLTTDDVLEALGIGAAHQTFAHVPLAEPDQLVEADAVILGTSTQFGNMSEQMRRFLDQAATLWSQGGLVGKVASVFANACSKPGDRETTICNLHRTLLHHGMIVVGESYFEQRLLNVPQSIEPVPPAIGCLPDCECWRLPCTEEIAIARAQGRNVATIASRLASGRTEHNVCRFSDAARLLAGMRHRLDCA